jgi:hypothetical protein
MHLFLRHDMHFVSVKLVKKAPVVGADSESFRTADPSLHPVTTAFSSLVSVSATILARQAMPVRPARRHGILIVISLASARINWRLRGGSSVGATTSCSGCW